uniref:Uncharacterized protein n=1 Tax=Parvoviridae sp. TaxID=1940570 RepID=A0A893ABI3_9VIRU|nr:MAG: hypothetical protein 2 [Parvoviridae sp.]
MKMTSSKSPTSPALTITGDTTSLETILTEIHNQCSTNLWLTNPKFWTKFPELMEEMQMAEEIAEELESLKVPFKQMANYFQQHKEITSGLSLIEALPLLKHQMVSFFKMSFSVELMSELLSALHSLNDTLIATLEASYSSPATTTTYTSSTTVEASQETDRAGANGKRKRPVKKAMSLEDDFSDSDDEEYESSIYPTGNVSSYTSLQKDGVKKHRILTEKYKPYLMKLEIWQSKDLRGPDGKRVNWQDMKKQTWKVIQMTYDGCSKMASAVQKMEEASINYLAEQKGKGKKIKRSFPDYSRFYRDSQ